MILDIEGKVLFTVITNIFATLFWNNIEALNHKYIPYYLKKGTQIYFSETISQDPKVACDIEKRNK